VLHGRLREELLLVEERAPFGERAPAAERKRAQATVGLLVVRRVRDVLAAAQDAVSATVVDLRTKFGVSCSRGSSS
jgi:hypothetical protein